jgi:hypothetical protein
MKLRALMIGVILFAAPAAADMGQIHVSAEGVIVSESAQKAIILVNGQEEVLILGTEMAASKKTPIVRFIPFPSEPKVELAPKGVFDRMAALVKKYALQYVTVAHSKGGAGTIDTAGVEVHFAAKMGGHDLTVIRVRDAAAIRNWVNAYFKKKHLPTRAAYGEAEKIVHDYVARGIDWFVVDAVELSPAGGAIAPVAYRFASKALYYPLLTSNTFGGKGAIELYVLGPSSLCAPGSNVFFGEGDKAIDTNGRETGPCFGLEAKASTSAMLVPAEHDMGAILPTAEAFFAGKPVFLQAIRYAGPYKFEHDVEIALPQGVAKALAAPEPGENPFAAALLPQEHAQCKKVPERGPCKALFERYHFDAATKSCKAFDWGGCDGVVPFETLEDCRKTCEGK